MLIRYSRFSQITEVQHRLGHANPAITFLVYLHILQHAESGVTTGSSLPVS